MNGEKRIFQKGEFITNTNKPTSFAIFEGIEMESYGVNKKYSVIAAYDPSKYRELPNGGGWASQPYLEVATSTTRCEQTVDGDTESYWWKPCTPEQKEKAIATLEDYGYHWNEELMAIVDKETGEIVRTIVVPKLEYHGEVVKPITQKVKAFLLKVCKEINMKKYSYQTNYYSGGYGCWDEYWD